MRLTNTCVHGLLTLSAGVIIASCSAKPALATALPSGGTLTIQNLAGTFAAFTSTPTCFSWANSPTCSGASHQMTVLGSGPLFSTSPSVTDQIKDLSSFPPPNLTDFETVAGGGALAGQTIHFDLTGLVIPGAMGNCLINAPGTTCTPANSPFTLTEDSTGTVVTITFTALLNGYTGTSTSGFTPYVSLFSTTQTGPMAGAGGCVGLTANITNILNCEAAGGTIGGATVIGSSACTGGSGSLVCAAASPAAATSGVWTAVQTPVPEPVSLALFGPALLGFAYYRARLRRRE